MNFRSLAGVTDVTNATSCDAIQVTCLTDVEIPVTETEDMPTVLTETRRAGENGAMPAMGATAGIVTAVMVAMPAMPAMGATAGIVTAVMAVMVAMPATAVMAATAVTAATAVMAGRIEIGMIVTIGVVLHWKGAPVTVTEAAQAMREALGKVDTLPIKLLNLTVKNCVTGTGPEEKPKKPVQNAEAAAQQLLRSHKVCQVMRRPFGTRPLSLRK